MLKIGVALFALGVILLLPFDEIFILLPLVFFYGLQVIPIYYTISLLILVAGALLMGIHFVPWLLKNPIAIAIAIIVLVVIISLYLWVW